MTRNIFCIIVTYNAMKWVDKCLQSLQASSVNVNVVVIDNCSKDTTTSYIREHYPEVHLIENKQNRGFGQANNQGIEYALANGGTHFFLLNQDAWPDDAQTIERLVEVQDKYDLAVVSPIHLNGSGNSMDDLFFESIVVQEKNNKFVSDMMLNCQEEYYEVFKVNAAAWMMSRKTIEEIGTFDSIFFHYGEDVNYCQRLKYHKRKMAFIPDAFIHHDRLVHGNTQVFKKMKNYSLLLALHGDINRHIINKESTICHFNLVKSMFAALLHGRVADAWQMMKEEFKVMFNTGKILQSRKRNKILKTATS